MANQSDNFNRGDEDLDGGTASGGGTWDEFENAGWTVDTNRAKGTRAGNHVDQSARLDGVDLDGDDHEVEATLAVDNTSGSYFNIGVLARKEDNATKTFYAFVAKLAENSDWNLSKYIAGAWTSLESHADDPVVTDVMRLHCDGTTITGYVNDVEKCQVIDDTIGGATFVQCGLHLDHGSFAGDASLDDWSAQDLAAVDSIAYLGNIRKQRFHPLLVR